MIMLDDIIVSIILNHTKSGVTPIELKMIHAELQGEKEKYLGDAGFEQAFANAA